MSAPDTPPDAVGQGPGARERLQRISRHFLSEADEIRRIAALTDPDEPHSLPLDGLVHALAGLGRSVILIDTAAGLVSLTRPDPTPLAAAGREPELDPERAMSRLRGSQPPDLMIVRTPRPAEAFASCHLALLAVPAHNRGMRSAYLRLKTLSQQFRLPPVGITLTGVQARDEAAAAFGKFAVAAQRFLDIRVTSYSYLAAEPAPGIGRGISMASLVGVARLLLEDLYRPEQRGHDGGNPTVAMPLNVCIKGQA